MKTPDQVGVVTGVYEVGFNSDDYSKWNASRWHREPPGQARKILKEQLKTKPFFLKKPTELFAEDAALAAKM
ncbi:MAG TPA: hypothetical protein PK821_05485 [Victivallales bacterium]|nr:hypothetical protein [Victivallales bacterium]